MFWGLEHSCLGAICGILGSLIPQTHLFSFAFVQGREITVFRPILTPI